MIIENLFIGITFVAIVMMFTYKKEIERLREQLECKNKEIELLRSRFYPLKEY